MTIRKWAIILVGLAALLVAAVVLTIHFYLPTAPYERACKLLQRQRYEEAIEQFTTMLAADPTHVSALINRGVAHAGLGQHDRAIADYTAAIGLEPGTYVPYKNRALAHAEQGDVAAAIADYEQYLCLSRNDPSEADERRHIEGRIQELRQQLSPSSGFAGGLIVEEYPLVAAAVDSPGRFEFLDRIPDDVLARRAAWRGFDAEQRVNAMNEVLAPFSYRLVAEENAEWHCTFYDLYHEDELVRSDLSHVWPVAVNESGTDFACVAENAPNEMPLYLLIRNGSVQPLDWTRFVHGVVPVYLGDDLVTVESVDNYGMRYAVKRGDEVVYTYTASKQFAGSPPVKRLAAWEGHWILETVEGTFVDGESLDEQLGVDEIFHYVIFQGRPLFFFERGGRVDISYGGETLPQTYDEVVHYQCCEPSVFNIESNEHMLWFYALKDGIWHYVEMGIYDE
ncbi:MAG: tetratricopeptide repeat protein [Chloroflexota bacterium]|nr:tetratricopeptide repeat protein [Chloroflexota bacterium]